MEKDVCELKHETIDRHFELTDKRLDTHGNRLDKLEIGQVRTDTIVENLCKQIQSLVNYIKALIVSTIGALFAFFIWYVQSL